jgi:hypothetical protein
LAAISGQDNNKTRYKMQRLFKMNKVYLLTILTTLLYSCDPYGGYEYEIENNSTHDIQITYAFADSVHINTLKSNEKVIIAHFETINGLIDIGDDFLEFFDSLTIKPIESKKLVKDIYKRNNWDYKAERTARLLLISAGENRYKLTITNSDIADNN